MKMKLGTKRIHTGYTEEKALSLNRKVQPPKASLKAGRLCSQTGPQSSGFQPKCCFPRDRL